MTIQTNPPKKPDETTPEPTTASPQAPKQETALDGALSILQRVLSFRTPKTPDKNSPPSAR